MKSKLSLNIGIKNIFKKDETFTTKCRICDLEFPTPERTKKHMVKAHSKPKRTKER